MPCKVALAVRGGHGLQQSSWHLEGTLRAAAARTGLRERGLASIWQGSPASEPQ